MPRCITCDYCTETDGNDGRKFFWNEKYVGYECNKCYSSVRQTLQGFYNAEQEGEITHWVNLEWDELGSASVLELSDVEENSEDVEGG